MKTNSPNPVEGDVQELIYRCKDAVAHLSQMVEAGIRGGRYSVTEYRHQLKIHQIALAALTAEPLASTEKHEISNMQATGLYLRAWPVDREENERDGFNIHLYTTPPAQLLRPVEFPDIEENETAFKAGLNSLVDCLEDCGDAEQGLRLALRSISEKWHEVKS